MGEVQVRTSNDLGGLGDREGPPVSFTVAFPNVLPPMLGWLVVAGLLLLKFNRQRRAWWIFAPLVAVLILRLLFRAAGWLPSEVGGLVGEMMAALAFGLAAVWLLAPFLVRTHRFLTFLCLLPVLAVASALHVAFGHNASGDGGIMMVQLATGLAFGALVLALALLLTGWICRRRHRPLGLLLWFAVLVIGLWGITLGPFFVIAVLTSGGGPAWTEFAGALLAISGISLAIVLPFLLLSFANVLFRERLGRLLHLAEPTPPVTPLPSSAP